MTKNNSLKNNSSIGRSRYVGGSVEVAAAAVGHYIVGSSRPKSSSSVLTSPPSARSQPSKWTDESAKRGPWYPENWKIWSEQIRSDQKNHYFSDLDLISDQYLSQWSWSDLRSFLRMIWSEMIWNFQIINLVHFFLNQTIFSEWYYIMMRGGCIFFFQISFRLISINSCL